MDIYATLDTEGLMAHNPTWYLTKYGWVYSSWVQPVKRLLNDGGTARAREWFLGASDACLMWTCAPPRMTKPTGFIGYITAVCIW